MNLKDSKRASVAITGEFSAQEVVALVSQIMVGTTYVYSKDEHRRFYGKIVVELAEIPEDAQLEADKLGAAMLGQLDSALSKHGPEIS